MKRAGIDGYQLWSTAQLENKLIDMRDMYNEKITGIERSFLIGRALLLHVKSPFPECAGRNAIV